MGTFLATSLLAVPLIAWLSGTLLCSGATAGIGANFLRAARDLPTLLEILFSRYHHAAEFLPGRYAVDEVIP